MRLIRRLHLYTGLFLVPWILLYAVSALLFNHPEIGSKQKLVRFSSAALASTPMSKPVPLADVASSVVAQLNDRNADSRLALKTQSAIDYATSGSTGSELIFGNVTFPDHKVHLIIHVRGAGGTYFLEEFKSIKAPSPAAPFAISIASPPTSVPPSSPVAPLLVEGTIDRLAADTIPALFQKLGLDLTDGKIRITQVPDLVFVVNDGLQDWQVRYNSLKGTVSGTPLSEVKPQPISIRHFVMRLHRLHVYPDELGSRWIWMLFVDVISIAMIFWACSGICMWWQLRAARAWGILLIMTSVTVAGYLAFHLHQWLTQTA